METNKAIERKPYFWVTFGDGIGDQRAFFETPEKFLEHLKDNDPILCGCEMLSVKQWEAVSQADPDNSVNWQDIND